MVAYIEEVLQKVSTLEWCAKNSLRLLCSSRECINSIDTETDLPRVIGVLRVCVAQAKNKQAGNQ